MKNGQILRFPYFGQNEKLIPHFWMPGMACLLAAIVHSCDKTSNIIMHTTNC